MESPGLLAGEGAGACVKILATRAERACNGIPYRLARVASFVLGISLSVTPGLAAGDSEEAWAALVKGGHVALIRHGNAPHGFGGDSPRFRLDGCKTARGSSRRRCTSERDCCSGSRHEAYASTRRS